MKRSLSLLLLSMLLHVLLLTTGCGAKDAVTITADPDSYSPLMSSVQGITLTPDFETKTNYEKLDYRWETTEGGFIGQGKAVENEGEAVVWSAVEGDQLTEIKDDFDIKLEVVEGESGKVLATAKITVTTTDPGFYSVKE